MSNYEQTKAALDSYIRAGVPLVVIRSYERHRIERIAKELAAAENFNIFFYTDARQIQKLGSGAGAPKDVDSDPLPFINELFQKSRHAIVVLGDTRKLNQDSLYTRELLGAVQIARETQNTIVVVAGEEVWSRLSHFGLFLTMGLPDFDERQELIDSFVDKHSLAVNWNRDDVRQVSTLLRGLSEVQIVNLLRSTLVVHGSLNRYDIFEIGSKKELLFTSVSNVDPVTVHSNLEVAGLENLKAWLSKKKDVLFAAESTLRDFNLEPPKGILLVGVPGCGKSFSAKIIASKWGLPLFRFDIGSVYNKYVGETERLMHEALEYIDNMAPCVLWVDEIEKALSTSSGESDVGKRVLGQFLFWLQESKAKVFLVATANDITVLPPELFRKGRFSEIFFVDLPNVAERIEAIQLFVTKSLHTTYTSEELRQLAGITKGFSYSDIEQAVKDEAELVAFQGKETPSATQLATRFETVIPISKADDRVELIRAWGKKHALAASAEVEYE